MRINIPHIYFNINNALHEDSSWPRKVYLVTTCFSLDTIYIITFKITGGIGLAHTGEGSHLLALHFSDFFGGNVVALLIRPRPA
jgi:hypothetical protein